MPTHFKTYALSQNRISLLLQCSALCVFAPIPRSAVLCLKTSNKVQLRKQAKAIHLEIQHLKSFVNTILRS